MDEFIKASVNGIPLFAVVLGLVQYVKTLGLKGKELRLVSMGIGLVLGGGYQISTLGATPYTYSVAFGVVIYGLVLGLVASGVYDVITNKPQGPAQP